MEADTQTNDVVDSSWDSKPKPKRRVLLAKRFLKTCFLDQPRPGALESQSTTRTKGIEISLATSTSVIHLSSSGSDPLPPSAIPQVPGQMDGLDSDTKYGPS